MERISTDKVHEIMKRYTIGDGMDIVYDHKKSHGSYLYDAKRDKEYLDMFTFFASLPIGHNHPKLLEDEFFNHIAEVAVNKPSNSDIYTKELAEWTRTFANIAKPDIYKYLFFISGGALAVENALKVSMDWKVRKNFERGYDQVVGQKVLHFKDAFHGRTGYTLSLTNTFDPRKYQYFTRFDWPRIDVPNLTFPVSEEVKERVKMQESQAIRQINQAIDRDGDDIAAFIMEPIQGEGGDRHFRPEFLRSIQNICKENDIMFVVDEIQSGMGITGKWWAYQHYDIEPDMVAFGKKAQTCGIMVNDRVEEVDHHCFEESSRINSTWGGNLVDMVRSKKYLEVIEEEDLIKNAKKVGNHLKNSLLDLQEEFDGISNVRGKGLMCAFNLPSTERRDEVKERCFKNGLLVLKSGKRAIRFRPPLNFSEEEVDQAYDILKTSINNSL